MTREAIIHQALLAVYGNADVRWLGRSADFAEAWTGRAEELCHGFGSRPAGARCPSAVFAQPLAKGWVAVCQVADLGGVETGPPAAIGFRVLVLSEADYRDAGGDPFALAEAYPPSWHARGSLPSLTHPLQRPSRTTEQVCEVLKRNDGPTLLGAAQALVDGGRVAWIRPQPQTDMVRGLWTLLPTSTRTELWPASFAFGNALGFDAIVVPQINKDEFTSRYLSEEQADNYPEGRYELGVQAAAEAGDQATLDALLARRSRREIWRLGWWLLAALITLTVAMSVFRAIVR